MHPRTAESLRLPLIDLPLPCTVTMLNGSSPQAGKIWKKANLTFSFDGKRVPPKYHPYAKVFGEEEFNKLPPHRHYDIGIELTKEGPLNLPLYSMTNAESATLKDWLRDRLKAGKIRPSKLSISSPVMFVPKKDGSRRLVVDYHDLMAQLRGAKVFTKLDLRWGYNNVRVKEGDKWKTAFQTKYGLYKSLVMTFGLTNAPAAFQHFMT
ncbi:Retrotransposable element Tf2 protein [Rhizoctonia solani]|uniref:Retrotransposable element Tf2 protein n=1 Tax=Rhizoctonia solani TaxID=456999 RepID=A0A8H8P248_9AGAM|nr:Retrotransposable element Tf2 protein [Rhizoctonia solani]QRW23178.1 Retrotransposable element Tf2 protein [Rhizoctonia solani]